MIKKRFLLGAIYLTGTLSLSACITEGTIPVGLLDNVSVGDTFSYQNQYFIVSAIAPDQSSVTIETYAEGFARSLRKTTFELVKQSDGTFRFSTDSMEVIYDPATGEVTWFVQANVSIDDLVDELGLAGVPITVTDDLTSIYPDTDNDGLIDIVDEDDDNDGVDDVDDPLPLDPSETVDTDGDGIGNSEDPDDDGDGVDDVLDSSPLDATLADLGWAKDRSDALNLGFLPSVPAGENWSEGTPSPNNIANVMDGIRDTIQTDSNLLSGFGYVPLFDSSRFTYDALDVEGVDAAHAAGWSGLGSNVYIIDGIMGNTGLVGYDIYGGYAEPAHGQNVMMLSKAVAPEADYNLVEYFNGGYSSFNLTIPSFSTFARTTDVSADVVNLSLGVDFTDYSNRSDAFDTAEHFIRFDMQATADALPNAVIVQSAGNGGTDSLQFSGYECLTAGGRNTTASCSDAYWSLQDSTYDALDRHIYVGAYDGSRETLTSYSFSAGSAAEHFIVADGNSILTRGIGTSYSAPRVTGAIALVAQKFPNLTAQARKGVILDTATDLGATGVDEVYGNGLLNVTNALSPLGTLK